MAHNGIADDDGGTKQADKPEAQGQDGFVPLAGIYPLVNEPQGEDDLPEGTVNEQPQGHVLVPEELADEGSRFAEHVADGKERGGDEDVTDGARYFFPVVLDI